ncbi:MAG: hypothetical protein H7A32_01715 [Deltaproteobacteria bacterium]|nr:hypothetical protein [Deltaproteobacteria bacterium]
MIHLNISRDSLDKVQAELAIIFAYEDIRPLKGQAGILDWRLNGQLSRFILDHRFNAAKGEALLMPSGARVGVDQLMILGLGAVDKINDQNIPQYLTLMLQKLMAKKTRSFCLTMSDLASGLFEWRNTVRLFISMLSGKDEDYQIYLLEPAEYVEDARARHMEFAYDVQVRYN